MFGEENSVHVQIEPEKKKDVIFSRETTVSAKSLKMNEAIANLPKNVSFQKCCHFVY